MRITWRGFELPSMVKQDKRVSSGKYGKFYIELFERGFGTTVGNSLRRVLLSSLEGSAVTSVKISGVEHEYSSIKGVMEDVTEIILNVKNLVVRLNSEEAKSMTVRADKSGVITAGDIEADPSIEILDKEIRLATLTEDVEFEMEMVVENGRGYRAAKERISATKKHDQEIGRILLDTVYSPVTRVRYSTENARVGQRTTYDRLIMEIWTNGSVTPEMALVEAAKLLRKHINPFVQYFELGEETLAGEVDEEITEEEGVDEELERKMNIPIQELELSVRVMNCLEDAKVATVGELVSMTESDLLKVRSFGKTSLREIKRKLADMGLLLGSQS